MSTVAIIVAPIIVYAILKCFLAKHRYKILCPVQKVKNDESHDVELCGNSDSTYEHSIIRQRNSIANKDQTTMDVKESNAKKLSQKEYNILPRPNGVNQGLYKNTKPTSCNHIDDTKNYGPVEVKHDIEVSNQLLNSKPLVDLSSSKTCITNNASTSFNDTKSQTLIFFNQCGLITSVDLKDLR